MKNSPAELPIIQMTYDLILWYIPILNRLPRNHRFTLGDRIIARLYGLLDELILARYAKEKLVECTGESASPVRAVLRGRPSSREAV